MNSCKGAQHNSARQEAERESAKKLTCRSEHRHQEDCESLSAGHLCCVVGWELGSGLMRECVGDLRTVIGFWRTAGALLRRSGPRSEPL